jgi:hypothetical protein
MKVAADDLAPEVNDIHRIGGGSVDNLRLKVKDATLNPPGVSVLKAPSPGDAARQMKGAFPSAAGLHQAADLIGSSTTEKIRSAGFDMMPNPTRKLPNHHRIIHPAGAAGFTDENLKKLSEAFTNTSGNTT